jgi:DNA-binding transcriptional MerR regulator
MAALGRPVEIPEKLYFKIGEVSRLAGVKPYVLRYWESEFPSLGPKKSGTNQRQYRRKDVELVLEIKRLLYEKRYTIEGARKFLQQRGKTVEMRPKGRGAEQRPKAVAAAAVGPAIVPALQGALFAAEPVAEENSKARLEPIRKELRAILEILG